MRILVVDDLADAARSLASVLALYGHDVRIAHDGAEALAVAACGHLDVVVLDIGLPDVNGCDVAKRLRKDHGEGLRLIAYTAWDDRQTTERTAACGFERHLTKPAALDDLLEALEKGQVPRGRQ